MRAIEHSIVSADRTLATGGRRPGRRLAALLPILLAVLSLACEASLDDRLTEIRALQDAGQFRESIEPLRAILQESPDNAQANHLLGLALFQTGEPSVAVYPLEKAAKAPETAVPAGLLLASAYLSTESFENAVRAADGVLAIDPSRPQAVYARGHANLGAGKRQEALADADRLIELTPDDYQALLLRAAVLWDMKRFDEAEKAYVALKESAATKDPTTAAKGWLALATFYRNREQTERASQEFAAILERYPTNGTALSYATQFYDETKRPELGTAVWRNAVKEAPENAAFRFALAQRLAEQGQTDEAEKVLLETTELFGTPEAWLRLAEFRAEQGRHAEAVELMEKAVALAGDAAENEGVYVKYAQMLADAGDLARAKEIVAKIQEPSYRDLLEGRILLAEGNPKEALARLDAGVRRWPNNAGARYLAGRAAMELGDFERAASEFREAYRSGPEETEASLALASLELSRGDYQEAAEFASKFLSTKGFTERPSAAEAYAVIARAATALDEFAIARDAAKKLGQMPGQKARATVELAAVERKAGGPKAAAAAIEKSGVDLSDPANEAALRALVDDLVATSRSDDALRLVDAGIASHPEAAAFHDLRGRVLSNRGASDDAKQSFERALAIDPEFAPALSALATLAFQGKDAAKAIELADRAAKARPNDSSFAYQAAQFLLATGRSDEAAERLRAIVRLDPGNAAARNDLAWILADRGQELDLALSLAQQASALAPSADVLDTLGWVQLQRKDAAAAAESFRRALELRPDAPSIRYRLGLALAAGGDNPGALRELQASLGQGAFPEADAARAQIARLEQTSN